jgi:histone H3/H4
LENATLIVRAAIRRIFRQIFVGANFIPNDGRFSNTVLPMLNAAACRIGQIMIAWLYT